MALCREADGECAAVQGMARASMDVELVMRVSNLRALGGEIWRLAVNARHGEYEEGG